ncbi:MAG: hypothetical protein ABIE07_14130 [Candidatus Zixiibacteriota bacterium]
MHINSLLVIAGVVILTNVMLQSINAKIDDLYTGQHQESFPIANHQGTKEANSFITINGDEWKIIWNLDSTNTDNPNENSQQKNNDCEVLIAVIDSSDTEDSYHINGIGELIALSDNNNSSNRYCLLKGQIRGTKVRNDKTDRPDSPDQDGNECICYKVSYKFDVYERYFIGNYSDASYPLKIYGFRYLGDITLVTTYCEEWKLKLRGGPITINPFAVDPVEQSPIHLGFVGPLEPVYKWEGYSSVKEAIDDFNKHDLESIDPEMAKRMKYIAEKARLISALLRSSIKK